jgi:AcrR family transcriptional regulator
MEERWGEKGTEKARGIARAAARLFGRKGYLETSMDEIAHAAGISKGGMYYYFPSKSDVLFFILSNYLNLVLENLEEELTRVEGHEERLKFVISRHIEHYSNNTAEARLLLHEAHCLPQKMMDAIKERERYYFRVVSDILEALTREGLSKERATVLTFSLFGMCNWIYSWYNPEGAVAPGELAEIIYDIFMGGVRKE